MFDKITIRAKVTGEECAHLAQLHHLHVWTNADQTQVELRSGTNWANITGVQIKIVRNVVTLTCSLHKYWENMNFGRLRNDTIFSMSEAMLAFESLIFENGFTMTKVRVVQFEVGVNLHVSHDPLTFIELVNYISASNRTTKIMFVDANYHINRQKTTEKYRDIRKYFKIYDKGWEMAGKKRGKDKTPVTNPDEHILRIETVYRRHNERADKFFTQENVKRLAQRFYVDWKDLYFQRTIRAQKGCKRSEKERAVILVNTGAEEYMKQMKELYAKKQLTEKEYRTIREFVRDFDKNEDRYKILISEQENEYKTLLPRVFKLTNQ